MTIVNSVGNALTGSTGSGAFVGDTSPTLVTPVLGAATATSINFGGTALANYVEGTFTPVLKFGGGTTGITYTLQTGEYRQIGKIVFFALQIVLSNKGSSTGSATITGLPVAAITSSDPGQICNAATTAIVLVGGSIYGSIKNGATELDIYGNVTASGVTVYADTNFANNSEIYISGTYLVP